MRPELVAFLDQHRRSRTHLLTDRLVGLIELNNPGYRATRVVPRADLWVSCHENINRVLELLGSDPGGDAALDEAYDAARATGQRRAEQGLPLDDVLRSFRMGGRLIWEDVVEQGGAVLDADALREVGTRVWEVVDETSAQVAEAYHRAERDAVRADEALRAELWEGLLSGRAKDAGFAHEAGRILDLPPTGDVLVVTGSWIDRVAADAALSPHATSWTRRAGGVVGLIALRDPSPADALAALATVAERSLGVSVVIRGLAGVDAGFRQASVAMSTLGGEPGVAPFDARLPEALLLSAPEVAGRLVAVWLGPLLALPEPEHQPLLDTLSAWVATAGSTLHTAERVHCHRNTVLNRLRRIGELTGRELLDRTPPLELALALRALGAGLAHEDRTAR